MGNAAILYSWLTTAMSPIISLRLHLVEAERQQVEGEPDKELLPQSCNSKNRKPGRERLGFPSLAKPVGPIIWFHAVSVGEAMGALPIIKKCREDRPSLNILMTTSTKSAFAVQYLQKLFQKGSFARCDRLRQALRGLLYSRRVPVTPPRCAKLEFAPVDTPAAVDRFLTYWKPRAAVFMESELWPNLILATSSRGVALALLNARMSPSSYWRWSLLPVRGLAKEILTKFSLITPVNNKEAVRYQNLGANPHQIHFGGNLKYASGAMDFSVVDGPVYRGLREQILGRPKIWLAASTHPGEEKVVVSVHKRLKVLFPNLLTIIVPRHPERGAEVKNDTLEAIAWGPRRPITEWQVSRRSLNEPLSVSTEVYIADTLGELAIFYHLVDVAFVGGSLTEGLNGHNIAEPASAGCAVITGRNVGHFQKMIEEMQTHSPLSVEQVSGEDGLFHSVRTLLESKTSLAVRREAALSASNAAAANVVNRVFRLLQVYVLNQALGEY